MTIFLPIAVAVGLLLRLTVPSLSIEGSFGGSSTLPVVEYNHSTSRSSGANDDDRGGGRGKSSGDVSQWRGRQWWRRRRQKQRADFQAGRREAYLNLPTAPETDEIRSRVDRALARPVAAPRGLRHAVPPGRLPGRDVVMGLAAYPRNMRTWTLLVGSLRNAGYDGHIIFGVHKDIPPEEEEYLRDNDVTYYEVDFVECDEGAVGGRGGGNIRGRCARGLEGLTLEWGRFEMARQWLEACRECTGWALVADTRDLFFQAHPFRALPPPDAAPHDLLFVEEISSHASLQPAAHRWYDIGANGRYKGHTEPCYGRDHWRAFADRPVLCSGTVVGTRAGMTRFLSVLVDEFYAASRSANVKCKSPHATDQWDMNYLYYSGRFGRYDRTRTLPWGTGPVYTIGHACVNTKADPPHSQRDQIEFDAEGRILNNHEREGSPARVAPAVHQYDRCHRWIVHWFRDHPEMFATKPELPWRQGKENNERTMTAARRDR